MPSQAQTINVFNMENIETPAEEVKPAEVKQEAKPEAKTADLTPAELAEEKTETKEETVPLATFLELKKETKEARKEVANLKKLIEDGGSKTEINKSIQSLADEHNIDAKFLQDFAESIKKSVSEEADEKIASKLKPIQEKEQAEKVSKAFDAVYDTLLENNPEYKGICNKEVIKALSLNPLNKNKTFNKIIEEAYGHLVKGKKTIDSTAPRGGKDDAQTIDLDRMKDPAYFKEVTDNPVLYEQYKKSVSERLCR